MAKPNRRRDARIPVTVDEQIALYVGNRRIEGRLFEESDRGLGIVLPHDCGLRERQTVQVMFRRTRRDAKVAYVTRIEDGDRVGLTLEA